MENDGGNEDFGISSQNIVKSSPILIKNWEIISESAELLIENAQNLTKMARVMIENPNKSKEILKEIEIIDFRSIPELIKCKTMISDSESAELQ